MNKKEISELKKQFTPDNCTISRICGCYVDSEKEKRLEMRESFLSLSDEEMFKYFEIFKKTFRNDRQKSAESGISTESRGRRRRAGISAAFKKQPSDGRCSCR